LFQLDALYGNYLYLKEERKLVPTEGGTPLEGALLEAEQVLADVYKGWCRSAHRFAGDCLGGALVTGKLETILAKRGLSIAGSARKRGGGTTAV
jgi:hypothetical protein